MTDLIARVRAHVAKMPPAVAGAHGHTATFKVAVALVHGFGLTESDALPIMEEYSSRCSPPWKREDLERKLKSAEHNSKIGKPRGYLLAENQPANAETPSPQRPKKKISLFLDTDANASTDAQADQKAAEPTPSAHPLADPDASGQATAQDNPMPPFPLCGNEQDEHDAAWIATQLKVFTAEGDIPQFEDGNPDTNAAAELAHWLELSRDAYQTRGIKVPDEEIRRTALACQFEHQGGMLPTPEALRGFLSLRLMAMHDLPSQAEQDGADPSWHSSPL